MKVVLAPDSFTGSMSAAQAAAAMAEGVRQADPTADVVECPMADGGEGTLAVVAGPLRARMVPVRTLDAYRRPITATYGLTADGLAVIEAARVVGLGLTAPNTRQIERATSLGLGRLIGSALEHKASTIIVGLGGTATCDGGAGLLVGMGTLLRDADGAEVSADPLGLAQLDRVDFSGLDERLRDVELIAATDVTHRLLGEHGAARVFAPQKGARPEQVPWLDGVLSRFADAWRAAGAEPVADRAGSGAAGGLGAALFVLGARAVSGVELVSDVVGLAEALADADLVITGEGALDAQTLAGKVPSGVLDAAIRAGIPTWAFAGRVPDRAAISAMGFAHVEEIDPHAEALDRAAALLAAAVARQLRGYRSESG